MPCLFSALRRCNPASTTTKAQMISSFPRCLEGKVRSLITEHIGLFPGNKYHLRKWPTKSNNKLCFLFFPNTSYLPTPSKQLLHFKSFSTPVLPNIFLFHYFLVLSFLSFFNNKNSNRVCFIMICVKGNTYF